MEPKKINVLVAEDDFLIAEEISRSLKASGYKVIGIAPNGLKAVELTHSLKPDVVLMDVKMPKMDGFEASLRIFENCPTPVVILTAHESQDLVEKASKVGIGAYLTKPAKQEEIERAITIAIARHKDLMESKKLIIELEDSRQRLNELNAAKDRFFSILAHDLRGPVSSLMVFSEQVNQNFNDFSSEELKEHLNVIYSTSKGISELLENLLIWANLQSNREDFNPVEFTMQEVIESVCTLLKAALENKSIELEQNIDLPSPVLGDKNMVHTILRNLIFNAVKFTPLSGKIKITGYINSSYAIISIKDTGIGISETDMHKIFRIDAQLSGIGTNGEKGNGLGLLICKEMVEKNGGEIWAESKLGQGSTFSFSLPLKN